MDDLAKKLAVLFQSTLPAGGATHSKASGGGKPGISIHAPRGGSDLRRGECTRLPKQFQSTLPAGGATHSKASGGGKPGISIHAPRGGSDLRRGECTRLPKQFQSTLPAGGATTSNVDTSPETSIFQSTLPAGGATRIGKRIPTRNHISIHAPRGGSDCPPGTGQGRIPYFNPRSPRGERPYHNSPGCPSPVISIHAPRGGSDYHDGEVWNPHGDFNPRSPRGERLS